MNINLSLLGQSITFLIFVWFTVKYVWPPLTEAMAERQKKIADGLASAERGEQFLSRAQNEATEILQQAKVKAGEIIDHANKRAAQIVDEAKYHAKDEADRLMKAAEADIAHQKTEAKEALRREVASVALLGAEKILVKQIDKQAHQELLERLAANL